jgi:hypothetical protein|tara:strand:+ start:85 stop:837 length:753 start_codon:yes stop_codon:yes gene_type:complete
MARVAGKSTDIYIDTHAVEGYASSFTFGVDVNLPEVTTFGDAASTFVEGKASANFSMNAFFDGADNKSDEITDSALTGTSEVFYIPSGMTIGNLGYHFQSNLSNKSIDNPVDGATALNVTGQGSSNFGRHAVLYTAGSTALSATGAVTASRVDTGSASSVGSLSAGTTKRATLRITAVSGSGTATIKIQDSASSGSGHADFVAFAQISGVGTQTVTTTDACNRYLQFNVTQYAGFTNFNCVITFGVDSGT